MVLFQEMLLAVSKLMQAGHWLIKALTFDAAHVHNYIKESLFGVFSKCSPDMLAEIPWFNQLEYKELPPHVLPRLPLRLCYHSGETVLCLPGSCI